MPPPIGLAVKLALTPTGRRLIRHTIRAARSEEGRKLLTHARRVAAGPATRKLLNQARQMVKQPIQAATAPQTEAGSGAPSSLRQAEAFGLIWAWTNTSRTTGRDTPGMLLLRLHL
jgi:hypothetical protein